MTGHEDHIYFAARERAEKRLAEVATDPAVRHIHLTLASSYRERITVLTGKAIEAEQER
ncbi:hypothetical protein [Sphingomonas oleivorans]|uniref:hypothetical protein n=1 Tax=Sphingomonas oleivorans TaxID=1735121 RepID=UPI0013FD2000|nr:hypothetical protein [Sphingomonas oleivorans]